MEKHVIDCEPKWVDLVPILMDMKDKQLATEEVMKMAVIADQVRQAQKKKEKLVFDFTEDTNSPSFEGLEQENEDSWGCE